MNGAPLRNGTIKGIYIYMCLEGASTKLDMQDIRWGRENKHVVQTKTQRLGNLEVVAIS